MTAKEFEIKKGNNPTARELSKTEPLASTQSVLQEKTLDGMEIERRMQLGHSLARPVSLLMLIGAGMVFTIWWLQPQYTQFIYYGFILLPPACIALLHPFFESKGLLALWGGLFLVATTSIAFLVPFLVPDALLAMAIAYVLVFLLGGLILGSKNILWLAVFCVPALISNIIVGHGIEERWFLSLDQATGAIVAPSLGGFLLMVSAVIVYLILSGQEKLYRLAQRATIESEKAKSAAEEANQAKGHLLAKVSHELRTPLGGVLGYAELLRDNSFGVLSDEQRQVAVDIIENANYLGTMVGELLDEAQMEARTIVLHKTSFSPTEFLQQAISGMTVQARTHGLAFVTTISPDLPQKINGDDHRLKQILLNLVGNAIKFTKAGEVHVSLLLHDDTHWMMQVSDTGMGIPKEAQSYIFESFRQADNALLNENRGIGLGLSVTRRLVELMGGEITLESEVGRGSTFSAILPLE